MNDSINHAEELDSYQALLSQVKRRDAMFFRAGVSALAIILIVTCVVIIRWVQSIDERISSYQSSFDQAAVEVGQLRAKIQAQENDLEIYRTMVRSLNDASIKVLVETSAEHRRQIDVMSRKVQCILKSTDVSLCR